jgi:hypothetical protein
MVDAMALYPVIEIRPPPPRKFVFDAVPLSTPASSTPTPVMAPPTMVIPIPPPLEERYPRAEIRPSRRMLPARI